MHLAAKYWRKCHRKRIKFNRKPVFLCRQFQQARNAPYMEKSCKLHRNKNCRESERTKSVCVIKVKYEGKKRRQTHRFLTILFHFTFSCAVVFVIVLYWTACKVTEGRLVGLDTVRENWMITFSIRISPAHEIIAHTQTKDVNGWIWKKPARKFEIWDVFAILSLNLIFVWC